MATNNQNLPTGNRNNVTDRRAASPKRAVDVTASKVPVITKAAYNAIIRNQSGDVNLQMKRLAQMRNLLSQYLLLASMAGKDYNPQMEANKGREEDVKGVYNALRACEVKVNKAFVEFPLRVE